MTRNDVFNFVRDEVVPVCGDMGSPNSVDIRISGSVLRPTSRVWFVDIVNRRQTTSIVVKCGTMRAATPHQLLPRLTPTVPAEQMIPRQALALQQISSQLSDLGDSRFVGVQVLMHDVDRRILVMSRVQGNELLSLLHTMALPLSFRAREKLPLYSRMAGEWLRLFHDQVSLPPGVRVYTGSTDLHEQAITWLNCIYPQGGVWSELIEQHISRWAGQLPEQPKAILHGDYWPGNILVNQERIGVIDVLGWAEGSVYLDIAYYLLHLRASDLQVWLRNFAWSNPVLEKAEHEFLAGYFGKEVIETPTLYFFQTLALLAKWARNTKTLRESTGLQRARKQILYAWRSSYYRSLISVWINKGCL